VSVSVGISHGKDAKDVSFLFKHADEALYETKRRGKSGYTFYSIS
jgi:PleD family two-component response regulator